jgi:large subunit ribosomal protein L4
VLVVDEWAFDVPRTKDALEVLGSLGLRTKGEREDRVLIVVDPVDENTWKSFRNLGVRVQLVTPNELNTYDILVNDWLVFSKATLESAVARFGSEQRDQDQVTEDAE